MQIILTHPRRLQGRQLVLKPRHVAAGIVTLLATTFMGALLLTGMFLQYGESIPLPFLQQASSSVKQREAARPRPVREDVAVMMLKLGDMQARLMRLDSLGQRVQHLAGVDPETFNFDEVPGRGGFQRIGWYRTDDMNLNELQQAMDTLAVDLEHRSDYLNAVEAALTARKEGAAEFAIVHPVSDAINSSTFGLRADPFTGHAAFHEGLDFAAPEGTPILAAASGVVIAAVQHEHYGNMVDISHGNDVVTRYAHASRLHVRRGDLIRRGQHIADVGSTGRSTGAHLHFEVQVGGIAQDPAVFLANGAEPLKVAARSN